MTSSSGSVSCASSVSVLLGVDPVRFTARRTLVRADTPDVFATGVADPGVLALAVAAGAVAAGWPVP
ncbi:hypothetical protein, partial [Nocardia anaemiae]|uniref:hypothetical protein n=1 Tax=Nocardia anaemiae TaxID=263910 RepID=UPI000A54689B